MSATHTQAQEAPSDRISPRSMVALVLLLAALVLLWWLMEPRGRQYHRLDEISFHWPQIEAFVQTWPTFGEPYPAKAAMAPGYHLALAAMLRFKSGPVADGLAWARVANLVVALVCVSLVWRFARKCGHPTSWGAVIVILPLVGTYSTLGALWSINSDLAALACTVQALRCLVAPSGQGQPRNDWCAGLWTAAAILVRQSCVWLLALHVVALLRARPRMSAISSLVVPFFCGAYLWWLWQGPTPPEFRAANAGGFSPAVFAYVLAMVGVYGLPYALFLDLRHCVERWRILAWAFGMGVIVAVLTPTVPDVTLGRTGGALWSVAEHLPNIAGRNALFLVAVPLGAASMAAWLVQADPLRAQSQKLLVCGLACLATVHLLSSRCYEHYFTGGVYLALISFSGATATRRFGRWAYAGPLVFGLLLTLRSFAKLGWLS